MSSSDKLGHIGDMLSKPQKIVSKPTTKSKKAAEAPAPKPNIFKNETMQELIREKVAEKGSPALKNAMPPPKKARGRPTKAQAAEAVKQMQESIEEEKELHRKISEYQEKFTHKLPEYMQVPLDTKKRYTKDQLQRILDDIRSRISVGTGNKFVKNVFCWGMDFLEKSGPLIALLPPPVGSYSNLEGLGDISRQACNQDRELDDLFTELSIEYGFGGPKSPVYRLMLSVVGLVIATNAAKRHASYKESVRISENSYTKDPFEGI